MAGLVPPNCTVETLSANWEIFSVCSFYRSERKNRPKLGPGPDFPRVLPEFYGLRRRAEACYSFALMFRRLLLFLVFVTFTVDTRAQQAPVQRALRLNPEERISVDGRLEESGW